MPYAVAALVASLAGCSIFDRPQRPAWRGQAEKACIQSKLVRVSAYVQPARTIDGPGICGMESPFRVAAFSEGTVALSTSGTLACPMIAEIDRWIGESVQPVAQARFGQPVVAINPMATYGCRGINNQRGAKLSEHAFGNAIDIGSFTLADGREVSVRKGWKSADPQEQAFLREVHAGACNSFTTVLGPGSDMFHYDHLHIDLARHGNTSAGPRKVCKPVPSPQLVPAPPKMDDLPDPPDLEIEQDIANAAPPGPATAYGMGQGLALGAPPAVESRALAPQRPPYAASQPAPRTAPPAAIAIAPRNLAPMPPAMIRDPASGGFIRDDGVFVPADEDTTSTIGKRK